MNSSCKTSWFFHHNHQISVIPDNTKTLLNKNGKNKGKLVSEWNLWTIFLTVKLQFIVNINVYQWIVFVFLKIQGSCSDGYEKVKELFEENFKAGEEENAQLCVYVDGQVVIDLYGTAVGDSNYGPDTLAVHNLIYSLVKYSVCYNHYTI